MTSLTTQTIVQIDRLGRQFSETRALDDVSIQVDSGQVFGIVGENGAGKTTLIKHMLGQYKAQSGSVRMFGVDPVRQPEAVLSRIGYLSEEPDLPAWMRISELLNYSSAFYAGWDRDYAAELLGVFGLDLKQRVRNLSKGMRTQLGLCLAQAHRPELLLLDEPSSGLDPNVRRDILSAIIRTVADEGRTVIFSSHLLEEVERVSDQLMMLQAGKVLLCGPMDKVLANHHRIMVPAKSGDGENGQEESFWRAMPGLVRYQQTGAEWQLDCYGDYDQFQSFLAQAQLEVLSHRKLSLNDIFLTYSGGTSLAGMH